MDRYIVNINRNDNISILKLTRHLSNGWRRYAGAPHNVACSMGASRGEGPFFLSPFSFPPAFFLKNLISLPLTTTWSWNNARIRDVLLRQVNVHLICNAPSKPRVQVFVFQCVHRIQHDRLNLVPTEKPERMVQVGGDVSSTCLETNVCGK